jgi:predicted RNase H-like HicB family nuclease
LTSTRHPEQYPQASWSEALILMRYAIVLERGPTSYGPYVLDLPGCVAAAETRDEALRLIREAIEFHIEEMEADGTPVPEPSSSTEYVEIVKA